MIVAGQAFVSKLVAYSLLLLFATLAEIAVGTAKLGKGGKKVKRMKGFS